MSPEDRARKGLFLAFQYPVEIPGVTNANFLKTALNEIRKANGLPSLDSKEFLQLMKENETGRNGQNHDSAFSE